MDLYNPSIVATWKDARTAQYSPPQVWNGSNVDSGRLTDDANAFMARRDIHLLGVSPMDSGVLAFTMTICYQERLDPNGGGSE